MAKVSTNNAKTVAKSAEKPVKKVAAAKVATPKAVAPKATAPKEVAPKSVAPKAVKAKEVETEFKVFAPGSGTVEVAGDFNSWKRVALKKGKDGNWSVKIKLAPGTYQYKVIFDGTSWELDHANPERVPSGNGSENSVKHV
ncbi:hypothetical protein AGMMS49938_17800 [Fibrobacterales bacterium]|nr:hypothetical protein AGMMS49938_17800 [Fibrobacterales bacterium]